MRRLLHYISTETRYTKIPNPPDRIFGYDLSSYTTLAERVTAINNLITSFYDEYDVYPTIVVIDAVVNAVLLGAY